MFEYTKNPRNLFDLISTSVATCSWRTLASVMGWKRTLYSAWAACVWLFCCVPLTVTAMAVPRSWIMTCFFGGNGTGYFFPPGLSWRSRKTTVLVSEEPLSRRASSLMVTVLSLINKITTVHGNAGNAGTLHDNFSQSYVWSFSSFTYFCLETLVPPAGKSCEAAEASMTCRSRFSSHISYVFFCIRSTLMVINLVSLKGFFFANIKHEVVQWSLWGTPFRLVLSFTFKQSSDWL